MVKIGTRSFSKPLQDIENRSAFLERLSVLLNEGYTFHDGLIVLLPHHTKHYIELIEQVESDFKKGYGTTAVLKRLGFSSSTLLPVIVSEVDGRLADALKGIAERLKRSDERKKKLRNLLLYPIVLFAFMGILLLAFRNHFLPNLQTLTIARNEEASGFVYFLPIIVSKIPDVMIGIGTFSIFLAVVGVLMYRRLSPSKKIRFSLAIPIIGQFFSKMKTRDFSGEIGSLLHSGLPMQDALEVLVEQNVDPIMSEIAKDVKEQVVYGESFDHAIDMTDGLRKDLSAYTKHGSDTGHLAKELLIYSENLQEMIEEEIGKWLAVLQPVLFTVLAICILSAYLALLLPVYGMFDTL